MGRHSATSRKGKHRAPSRLETFLRPTRSALKGNLLPLAVIALTSVGVTWAFNEGVKDGLRHQERIAQNPFIYTCGSVLCRGSEIFTPQPKVICSDALKDPKLIVDQALHDNQNTIEIGSILAPPQDKKYSEPSNALQRVDSTIAEAKKHDMRVILNLSDLVMKVTDGNTYDQWEDFVGPTSRHVNTVTGVAYADDPTLMMIKLRPVEQCSDQTKVANFKLEAHMTQLTKEAFPKQLVAE